jgi:hypothetical protein
MQLHTPSPSPHHTPAANYSAKAPPQQVSTLLAPKADVNTDGLFWLFKLLDTSKGTTAHTSYSLLSHTK